MDAADKEQKWLARKKWIRARLLRLAIYAVIGYFLLRPHNVIGVYPNVGSLIWSKDKLYVQVRWTFVTIKRGWLAYWMLGTARDESHTTWTEERFHKLIVYDKEGSVQEYDKNTGLFPYKGQLYVFAPAPVPDKQQTWRYGIWENGAYSLLDKEQSAQMLKATIKEKEEQGYIQFLSNQGFGYFDNWDWEKDEYPLKATAQIELDGQKYTVEHHKVALKAGRSKNFPRVSKETVLIRPANAEGNPVTLFEIQSGYWME